MNIQTLTEEVEKVSLLYTDTFGITRDSNWFILKVQEFRKELADVFAQLLLLAKHYNVDLEKEIENKWLVWTKK